LARPAALAGAEKRSGQVPSARPVAIRTVVAPRPLIIGPRTRWTPPLQRGKEFTMLMTFAVVLIVLWLLGMVTSYTMGGLIHILLVVAIIVILVRVIQGRKVL
jgi:Family of unknown function (DUF5670)